MTLPRRLWACAGALSAASVVLAACGGAGAGQTARSVTRTCQAVAAVLSDGPGQKVDPIGYAEAQILPLKALRLHDPSLSADVRRLDRAYKEVFETDGSAAARRAVATASARLVAVCPKAAP